MPQPSSLTNARYVLTVSVAVSLRSFLAMVHCWAFGSGLFQESNADWKSLSSVLVVISRVGVNRPAITTPLVAVQAAFAVGQAPAATVKTGLAQAAVLIKVNVEHVAKVAISGSGNRMFFLLQPHTRGIEEIGIKKIFAEKTILRTLGE